MCLSAAVNIHVTVKQYIYCWLSVQGTSLQVFRDLDSFLLKMEVYHLSYPFVSSKFILSTSCHWHLTSGVSSELLLTTAHFKLELEWRVWWTVYTSCVPPECNQLDDITSFQKTALLNNLLWSKHVHWEVSQSVFTGPAVVGKCPSSVLPFSRLLSLLSDGGTCCVYEVLFPFLRRWVWVVRLIQFIDRYRAIIITSVGHTHASPKRPQKSFLDKNKCM